MRGHGVTMFEDSWVNYAKLQPYKNCDCDCFRTVCSCSPVIHLLLPLSVGSLS